jgi:hypothetical protein
VTFAALIWGGTKLWAWVQTWEPDPLPPGATGRISTFQNPRLDEDGVYVLARGELRGSFWEIGAFPDGLSPGRAICLRFDSDGGSTETCGITRPRDVLSPFVSEQRAPRGYVEALYMGLCDPSVTRVEIRLRGGVTVPGHVVPFPRPLGFNNHLVLASFAGDLPGSAITYDASGNVVGTIPLR